MTIYVRRETKDGLIFTKCHDVLEIVYTIEKTQSGFYFRVCLKNGIWSYHLFTHETHCGTHAFPRRNTSLEVMKSWVKVFRAPLSTHVLLVPVKMQRKHQIWSENRGYVTNQCSDRYYGTLEPFWNYCWAEVSWTTDSISSFMNQKMNSCLQVPRFVIKRIIKYIMWKTYEEDRNRAENISSIDVFANNRSEYIITKFNDSAQAMIRVLYKFKYFYLPCIFL